MFIARNETPASTPFGGADSLKRHHSSPIPLLPNGGGRGFFAFRSIIFLERANLYKISRGYQTNSRRLHMERCDQPSPSC